jgi:hypothetical protein
MISVQNRDLGFDPAEYDSNPIEKAFRDSFANGLEMVLDRGADTLEAIAAGLNEEAVPGPGGAAWTPALLESELDRLGR